MISPGYEPEGTAPSVLRSYHVRSSMTFVVSGARHARDFSFLPKRHQITPYFVGVDLKSTLRMRQERRSSRPSCASYVVAEHLRVDPCYAPQAEVDTSLVASPCRRVWPNMDKQFENKLRTCLSRRYTFVPCWLLDLYQFCFVLTNILPVIGVETLRLGLSKTVLHRHCVLFCLFSGDLQLQQRPL